MCCTFKENFIFFSPPPPPLKCDLGKRKYPPSFPNSLRKEFSTWYNFPMLVVSWIVFVLLWEYFSISDMMGNKIQVGTCDFHPLQRLFVICLFGVTIKTNLQYRSRFFFFPIGIFQNILQYSRVFQNICARNISPCLPAQFLAVCLSEHALHKFCSVAMYSWTYKVFYLYSVQGHCCRNLGLKIHSKF